MEEDLAKEEIVLKPKKPRSEAQIKAFEKAREIRVENAKLKKEKIAEVKEQVKNRNKVEPQVITSPEPLQKKDKVNIPKTENLSTTASDDEPDIVIVKKKKKPKVIYMEESDEEPPQIIKKKKEEPKVLEPVLVKPQTTIRFC